MFLRKVFREIFLLQNMKQIVTKMSQKISTNYSCNICNYNTCRISDYKKHLQTKKHNVTNCNKNVAKNLSCVCGINFNNRTSLWRHSKKCNYSEEKAKAIKTIANENIKQINKWVQHYPDCIQSDSKKNDLYLKIVSNSMNGLTKEESEQNINKIITNVAKNVTVTIEK
jgi:hypothetical protein